VKEVATFFKPYTAIERIALIWKRVQELQGQLRTMLDEDFDALYVYLAELVLRCKHEVD
jgi:hypothetical protein